MAKKVLDRETRRNKRSLYLIAALGFAVLYSLSCFLLSPCQLALYNNVVYENSILYDIVELLNFICVDVAVSIAYAAAIFGVYRFGVKGYWGGIWLFIGAAFYKCFANTAMSWYSEGAIPRLWWYDLINILFLVILEAIQLGIAVFIINRTVRADREKVDYFKREKISADIASERPITMLYDKAHPLCRAALYSSIVIFVSKIAGELYNDVIFILMSGFPKEISTVFLMILNYLSKAVFGAICYGVILFTLYLIKKRAEKL